MGDYGGPWPSDELDRPTEEARPNEQTYNGVTKGPEGAWGDQLVRLARNYRDTLGDNSAERGVLPMGRGRHYPDPNEPKTAAEQMKANIG